MLVLIDLKNISKVKTKEEIQKLVKITSNTAVVKIDGVERIVTLDEINKGDIVVSINSGTDIVADASDVILTKNNLNSIINLIHISKRTIKNIKQKLNALKLRK